MNASLHLQRASLLIEQDRWQQAGDELKQALAEEPNLARAHSLLGLCHSRNKDLLREATREAEAGVGLGPDDDFAHYIMAVGLDKRNHFPEAMNAIDQAIAIHPESSTYYGLKSSLFAQQSQWRQALETTEIGLFVGMRVLRAAAVANPKLGPFVLPISLLYMTFCLLSWIANPLFNTFLRFHPFGKYLLSEREKWASNLVASFIAIGVAGALTQAIRGDFPGAILMLLIPVFLTLPILKVFTVDEGWPQYVCIAFSIVLGLLSLLGLALILVDGFWEIPLAFYGIGILIFSFLGNYLATVTVRQ